MTTTQTSSDSATTPTASGPVAGLPTPARRRRPWLVLVGLVIAALAAAMVAAALNAASATTLVWATASDVVRGQPVAASDLEPAEVPAEAADTLLAATTASRDGLVGRVWAVDLPAGQLLSAPLLVERLPVADGQALVGVRLDPGGFPTVGLAPGDAVRVVARSQQQGQPAQVLVEAGTVESVVVLSDQGPGAPRLVTLAVPTGTAAEVAAVGQAGRVALVVVP